MCDERNFISDVILKATTVAVVASIVSFIQCRTIKNKHFCKIVMMMLVSFFVNHMVILFKNIRKQQIELIHDNRIGYTKHYNSDV